MPGDEDFGELPEEGDGDAALPVVLPKDVVHRSSGRVGGRTVTDPTLRFRGRYSAAYLLIDFFENSAFDLLESTGWESLKVDHNTKIDWIGTHSEVLT